MQLGSGKPKLAPDPSHAIICINAQYRYRVSFIPCVFYECINFLQFYPSKAKKPRNLVTLTRVDLNCNWVRNSQFWLGWISVYGHGTWFGHVMSQFLIGPACHNPAQQTILSSRTQYSPSMCWEFGIDQGLLSLIVP